MGKPDVLQAQTVLRSLRELKITHVIGLPDNASASLFHLLQGDSRIQHLTVTREAEAFAIASGVWMGGGNPAVLIQNTGFLESGDSLRATAMRMRIPLLCLITYRGYAKTFASDGASKRNRTDPESLSSSHLDSAALITEPTLRAWGIPYQYLESDQEVARIRIAYQTCQKHSQPVVVLCTRSLT